MSSSKLRDLFNLFLERMNTGISNLVHSLLATSKANSITELSQREPPIFGWAAITLDIGPHSSSIDNLLRYSHF